MHNYSDFVVTNKVIIAVNFLATDSLEYDLSWYAKYAEYAKPQYNLQTVQQLVKTKKTVREQSLVIEQNNSKAEERTPILKPPSGSFKSYFPCLRILIKVKMKLEKSCTLYYKFERNLYTRNLYQRS